MNGLLETINSSQNNFIAPLVLTTIMIFGILIGFWNGFKTATYFFVLNIFCAAGAIAIFHFSGDLAKKLIPSTFKLNKTNVLELAKTNNNGVQNIVGLLGALTIYVAMNLVFFWPSYFIFRKSLKASMVENKEIGVSNIKHRIGGAIIGFLIALPVAILTAALLTPLGSKESGFVGFISEVSSIFLARQATMIPENIYNLVQLVK